MSGSSGRAVVVGAVTSAATFYAFGVTDFTGLLQMGYLTGTGILFCMVAVLLLLPAMLAWSEDHHQRRASYPRLYLHGLGAGRWVRFCIDHPRSVLATGLAVTGLAGYLATGLRFEDSVRAMRPKGTPEVEAREEIAERFGAGFDQMVMIVSGEGLDDVLLGSDEASRRLDPLVADGTLVGTDGISSLLPPTERQERVLRWLERARGGAFDPDRIHATFTAALAAEGLRTQPFAEGLELFLEAVRRQRPLTVEDLAASGQAARLMERYLLHTDEGWKSAIYLYPPAGMWRRDPPPAAVAVADALGPSVSLTGANVVSQFMRERVLRDAVIAAILGFLLVGILLWLDFGRMRETVLSLAPLCMGILWMLGAMVVLGIDMNFMNIFVATMIIGIGVDYGIHMIHRYRELGEAGDEPLCAGLSETGKAIVLAALSTVVGFGSLAQSHYPGLASMGMVATLGALSTSLVAISMLPAWIGLRRSVGSRDGGDAEPR
jgi:predicted exporter